MKSFKITLFIFLLSYQLLAQPLTSLPRSTPEAEGVSSQGIRDFIHAASVSKHEFHGFMMLRHGKVVAEGWWDPYRPDLKHTLYSVSKSFTATAVGFAVAEKKLNVHDKVISFFPDDVPEKVSEHLSLLEIKDLLSMSVGQAPDPTGKIMALENDWVKGFFKTPIVHKPGTKFLYNSAATYMLSAIVQKVTGQKVMDYLKPRLFDPLDIKGMDWEVSPKGINTGGWGLRLKTEDLAKFGQLFLQKGLWHGKEVLPAAWIEEATTKKIDQDSDAPQLKKDSSDWLQGYCYQMWRSRNNSYRADGAFGQYIIVLPEQDAVIAITAETSNMQAEFNLIWKHLLPSLKNATISSGEKQPGELKKNLGALKLPIPTLVNPVMESKISGKSYGMITTDRSLTGTRFDFKSGTCLLTLKTDSAIHTFTFGSGRWEAGITTKSGPYLVAAFQSNRQGLPPFKVVGSYSWKDEKTLELILRYIESPHTETILCTFDGDYVSIDFQNIFNKSASRIIHKGVLQKIVPNPPRLIVRGDDMGFSHSANEALMKSYKEGIETSIEVIVPSPWFPEAVKLLQKNKNVDVGLHFTITSEWDNIKWRPLTDCPGLRNQDGYFYPMIFPNKNYPKQAIMDNPWKPADYEKELRAQIEMAKKYIPRLSHISGHMASTGFTPEAKSLAKKIAAEYQLEVVDSGPDNKFSIHYTGFDFRGKTTEERIEGFINMLGKLEAGKTYVYVEHPGIDNDELRAISHIGYEDVAQGRQDVTTIFTSEKVKEAIYRKGIELVSYKQVLGK